MRRAALQSRSVLSGYGCRVRTLQTWVKSGTLPPSAPPIEVTSAAPPAVIARDKNGNSLAGGIRLAEIAVPTGVNTGQNSGAGFCRLYGSHRDFDAATVNSLYPTHEAYVAAVRDVTEWVSRSARTSPIPRPPVHPLAAV